MNRDNLLDPTKFVSVSTNLLAEIGLALETTCMVSVVHRTSLCLVQISKCFLLLSEVVLHDPLEVFESFSH